MYGQRRPLNKRTATYRTTFWGFSFEALPTAAILEEAVCTTLAWCAPRSVYLPLLK